MGSAPLKMSQTGQTFFSMASMRSSLTAHPQVTRAVMAINQMARGWDRLNNSRKRPSKKLAPTTIKQAFHLSKTGRPGPILVDLPKDVMADSTEFNYPSKIKMHSYNPTYQGHPGQIKRAAKLIAGAKKPLLYSGGGVISSNNNPAAPGKSLRSKRSRTASANPACESARTTCSGGTQASIVSQ